MSGQWRKTFRKGTTINETVGIGSGSVVNSVLVITTPWVWGSGAVAALTLTNAAGAVVLTLDNGSAGGITLSDTDGITVAATAAQTGAEALVPGDYDMVLLVTFGTGGSFPTGEVKDPLAGVWTVESRTGEPAT